MDQRVPIHLFKLYTMFFYGVETRFMKLATKTLNNMSTAYHKAIKLMCKKRPYHSNHDCLERVNLSIFKHLVAKKLIIFAFTAFQSNGPCFSNHQYYFRAYSNYVRKLKNFLLEKYLSTDVLDNPYVLK